jgi:hypothetical protein
MVIKKSKKVLKGNISSFVIMQVQVSKMRKEVLSMIQRVDELDEMLDNCAY